MVLQNNEYGSCRAPLCEIVTNCMYPNACAMPKSIGLDLYSPTSVLISAHDKVLINTGINFQIPMGHYG